MARTADVRSLEAIEQVRASLVVFTEEADHALTSIRVQVHGFIDWLKNDQLKFWQHEIRVREERVLEAKNDLSRCLAATIDPNRTPTCYQEKKVLAAAKRALEEAEDKLAAVRRWIPVVEQAASDYFARAETMASVVANDMPRAMTHLDRLLTALVEYQQVGTPDLARSAPATGSSLPTAAPTVGPTPPVHTAAPVEAPVAPPDEEPMP